MLKFLMLPISLFAGSGIELAIRGRDAVIEVDTLKSFFVILIAVILLILYVASYRFQVKLEKEHKEREIKAARSLAEKLDEIAKTTQTNLNDLTKLSLLIMGFIEEGSKNILRVMDTDSKNKLYIILEKEYPSIDKGIIQSVVKVTEESYYKMKNDERRSLREKFLV